MQCSKCWGGKYINACASRYANGIVIHLGLYFVCLIFLGAVHFLYIYKNIVSSGLGERTQNQFFTADSLRCIELGNFCKVKTRPSTITTNAVNKK